MGFLDFIGFFWTKDGKEKISIRIKVQLRNVVRKSGDFCQSFPQNEQILVLFSCDLVFHYAIQKHYMTFTQNLNDNTFY